MNSTDSGIPGPPTANFETTVQGLREGAARFVTGLVKTCGDIVRLPFGTRDLYLLNHPDFVRYVFAEEPEYFAKRIDAEAEEAYLNQISGFVPLFDGRLIEGYAGTMIEAASQANDRWQALDGHGGPPEVDMHREMMRLTLTPVAKTLFHADFAEMGIDPAAVVEALWAMDVNYGFNTVEAILGGLMPPAAPPSPKEVAAQGELRQCMQRAIDYRRETAADDASSFLAQLVDSLSSDTMAAGVLGEVFCDMHEVTTTLTWTWYLLAQAPDVEARLHDELEAVLGGRLPSYGDLPQLTYTRMVLSEARRLYPVVWLVGRFVRQDVSFADTVVPAGSVVLLCQWTMHRDPRYYDAPDQFRPERWTDDAVALRPEFCYFPFSAGPRKCAGRAFAETQDALILAMLAQHWQPRTVGGDPPDANVQRSSMPRAGIRMTLHRRSQ